MTPSPKHDPWASILDPGEDILWQGTPEPGITLTATSIFEALFGLAFAGFALFWMVMAAQAGGGFWAYGLIHFTVGVGLLAHAVLWPRYRRSRTYYSLTDRRAFIATDLPLVGRSLKSYPISKDTQLELIPGDPATVHFATAQVRTKNGFRTKDIGFERITRGEDVFRMMRDIQTGLDTTGGA